MSLPEPYPLTFSSLIADIEKGHVKIPQFQRDFVWNRTRSANLLDSIIKGYPIGTFIFWKTKEELRALRNIGGLSLPPTPKGDFIQYVLDGQQRLTTLFASIKGLTIKRDDNEEDYSEFYIDLRAPKEDQIVVTERPEGDGRSVIRLHDLLYGKIKLFTAYPEELQDRIQTYKDRINAYQFSSVLVKDVPIDVATEIFTRLNVSGKPLSVFEIMVAKTFDSKRNFDLAEKVDQLKSELDSVDYGTISEAVVLQTIAVLISKECRKKDILRIERKKIVDIWPAASEAIKSTVDYFRNYYRIPVSQLLPYPNLIVPFAYYFYNKMRKPTAQDQKYLQDFFWRAALGGRYSQAVESRLAQDVRRIDQILCGRLPKYDWAIDTSAKFVEKNGWFSVGRAYIKALLCVLAYQEPKSFSDNSVVRISNDWLKQANSKNYHHFFPKAFLNKKGVDDEYMNHIANITIVDDFLNKREIRAQAPSKYMRKFARYNKNIDRSMSTHLIKLDSYGVYDDDYDRFFIKRCEAFSRELKKRVIAQNVDNEKSAIPARDTKEADAE